MNELNRLLFDLIDHIAAADTVSGVWDAYLSAAREVHLGYAAACSVPVQYGGDMHLVADALPKGCTKGYVDNGLAAGDLVLERARHSTNSFEWHLSDWNDKTMTPVQRRWREHCATFGLEAGLCIMHFLPGEQLLLFNCGAGAPLEPHDRLALFFAGQEALMRFHEMQARPAKEPAFLSHRERECLQWAAAGKTDWEIGQILSLSEKTVNVYIDRAKHKFGVKTRTQAVIMASRGGTIAG